jgi:hypothetical protein
MMTTPLAALVQEHRTIEAELDPFGDSLAAGLMDVERFRRLRYLITQHYLREEEFLAELHKHTTAFAAKLSAQHAEVLEIGAQVEASLGAGQAADAERLARRFLALAQHNVIEEERDAFPLL